MDFFPAFLNLVDRPVLLVGAGTVAARKLAALRKAGALVTIVAPAVSAPVAKIADEAGLCVHRRPFRSADVAGHWLVVSATADEAVNRAVAAAASDARIFCNVVDDLENCSYIVPAIVDRSPLLVAISSAGTAPVLARQLRARIETWLPSNIGMLAALAGRWRERVRAQLASFSARRRFWEGLFDGRLQRVFDRSGVNGAEQLIAESLRGDLRTQPGRAWLVGAGPGDPGLLTLKALQAMQAADVILHDRLVANEVLDLARRDAELVSVGKTPGCTANSQDEINELLVRLVAAGKRVCRLKGGDPFVFGRGGEEAQALHSAGLEYEVVPGITAAVGCAAAAGIPLTHRDAAQSLTLLTGHGKDAVDNIDWASLAPGRQTLAIYMGVSRFNELMQNLTRHGRPAETPIAIIEKGTTPEQRVLRGTLGQLPLLARAHRIKAPAMLLIGEVTRLGYATLAAPAPVRALEATRSATESAINAAIV